MSIALNTSLFPIIVTRFPAKWSDEEIDRYFDAIRAVHNGEQRFVHITDVSASSAMSSSRTRKRMSDFTKAQRAKSARLCVGSAFVAPTRLLRGAVMAIQWASPPPFLYAVVPSIGEAMAWAQKRCTEEGLTTLS